jgi:hypothetical protein
MKLQILNLIDQTHQKKVVIKIYFFSNLIFNLLSFYLVKTYHCGLACSMEIFMTVIIKGKVEDLFKDLKENGPHH